MIDLEATEERMRRKDQTLIPVQVKTESIRRDIVNGKEFPQLQFHLGADCGQRFIPEDLMRARIIL